MIKLHVTITYIQYNESLVQNGSIQIRVSLHPNIYFWIS